MTLDLRVMRSSPEVSDGDGWRGVEVGYCSGSSLEAVSTADAPYEAWPHTPSDEKLI